jgi:hypothetical protein
VRFYPTETGTRRIEGSTLFGDFDVELLDDGTAIVHRYVKREPPVVEPSPDDRPEPDFTGPVGTRRGCCDPPLA